MSEPVERRGASVAVQDPRVSNVQTWIIGVVGAGIVGGTLWVGNNISSLRETVVRIATQNEFILQRLNDQDERLKNLERNK